MIPVVTFQAPIFIAFCTALFDVAVEAPAVAQKEILFTNQAFFGVAFSAVGEHCCASRTKGKIIHILLCEIPNITFAALRFLTTFQTINIADLLQAAHANPSLILISIKTTSGGFEGEYTKYEEKER